MPESIARAGITYRWLESDDEFRVPEEADFLLGQPEDGVIRGMSLPQEVLARIYRTNFERMVSATPEPLNTQAASAVCDALAEIAEAASGTPKPEIEASRIGEMLG